MKQTTGSRDYAAFLRLKLGFDPKEAVAAGVRRGLCQMPAPAPLDPLPLKQGSVGYCERCNLSGGFEAHMVGRRRAFCPRCATTTFWRCTPKQQDQHEHTGEV